MGLLPKLRMNILLVSSERLSESKFLATDAALPFAYSSVGGHVTSQILGILVRLVTDVTVVDVMSGTATLRMVVLSRYS